MQIVSTKMRSWVWHSAKRDTSNCAQSLGHEHRHELLQGAYLMIEGIYNEGPAFSARKIFCLMEALCGKLPEGAQPLP